jgi:hypothetical protein
VAPATRRLKAPEARHTSAAGKNHAFDGGRWTQGSARPLPR